MTICWWPLTHLAPAGRRHGKTEQKKCCGGSPGKGSFRPFSADSHILSSSADAAIPPKQAISSGPSGESRYSPQSPARLVQEKVLLARHEVAAIATVARNSTAANSLLCNRFISVLEPEG